MQGCQPQNNFHVSFDVLSKYSDARHVNRYKLEVKVQCMHLLRDNLQSFTYPNMFLIPQMKLLIYAYIYQTVTPLWGQPRIGHTHRVWGTKPSQPILVYAFPYCGKKCRRMVSQSPRSVPFSCLLQNTENTVAELLPPTPTNRGKVLITI